MPQPTVGPEEPQDWRPLLDRELRRLPERSAAMVLCDLEGLPRKEAARRLGIPEGTLSADWPRHGERMAARSASGLAPSVAALASGRRGSRTGGSERLGFINTSGGGRGRTIERGADGRRPSCERNGTLDVVLKNESDGGRGRWP